MAVDKVFVNRHSVARFGFRALVSGIASCDCAEKAVDYARITGSALAAVPSGLQRRRQQSLHLHR